MKRKLSLCENVLKRMEELISLVECGDQRSEHEFIRLGNMLKESAIPVKSKNVILISIISIRNSRLKGGTSDMYACLTSLAKEIAKEIP